MQIHNKYLYFKCFPSFLNKRQLVSEFRKTELGFHYLSEVMDWCSGGGSNNNNKGSDGFRRGGHWCPGGAGRWGRGGGGGSRWYSSYLNISVISLTDLISDEYEALADSISDSDSGKSSDTEEVSAGLRLKEVEIHVDNIEDIDTKDELAESINSVSCDLDLSGKSEEGPEPEPSKIKTDQKDKSQETVISVNLDGIDPDSILMPDCDLKSVSFSSLPPSESENQNYASIAVSVPKTETKKTSTESLPSMSSLQEMFDNISSTHENVEKACEEIEVELDVDVVDNPGPSKDKEEQKDALFHDYTLDDIIKGKVVEEVSNQPDEQDDNVEDDEDEDEEVESEESSSEEEEEESSFNNLYDLCDNYIDHLQNMLQMLQTELDRNQFRQEQIELEVTDLIQAGVFKKKNEGQHKIISRKPISIFAYPYFKDQDLFGPPQTRT